MAKVLRRALCILIAALTLAATPAMASYNMYFNTAAKVYQKPSSSSRSLSVPKGMKVKMVAVKGNWAMVKNGKAVAYCNIKNLTLSSRLKGYVSKKSPLYKSASKSSTKSDSLGVNTELYIIGMSGDYFRVQNKSASITGYIPKSCVSSKKVKASPAKPSTSKPSDWKSKVVAPDWYNGGSSVLKKGQYGTLYDISTGISIKVYRLGGSSHADLEPATAADAANLKKIAGGEYSWDSHAVILIANGTYAACAINTMPHGEQTITDNDYDGQFCLHMINSKTHGSDSINSEHQKAIQMAYRWARG